MSTGMPAAPPAASESMTGSVKVTAVDHRAERQTGRHAGRRRRLPVDVGEELEDELLLHDAGSRRA